MEELEELIPIKLICMSCLCIGTQYSVTEPKLQRFYLDILEDILPCASVLDIHVCWECEANIKKIVKFREQIRDSCRTIRAYFIQNALYLSSNLVRQPRLKNVRLKTLSFSPKTSREDDVKDEVKLEGENRGTFQHLNDLPIVSENVDALDVEIESLVSKANLNKEQNEFESVQRCPLSGVSPNYNTTSPITVQTFTYDVKIERQVKDSLNIAETSDIAIESDNIDPFEDDIETLVGAKKSKKGIKRKIKKAQKVVKNLKHGVKRKKSRKLDDKVKIIELSYEEMLSDRAKEAQKDSFINATYKCDSCIVGFKYNTSYKKHMSGRHSKDGGDYVCPICKRNVVSVDAFTTHYKRHLRRYECRICQKRTMDMKVMEQHYYSTHEIVLKEYKCDICGKISNSIDTHRYHKDTHKARVQCTECDKTFTHRAGLMNHKIAVHEFKNMFPCTVCDKVFRWKTSLKRHLEKHDDKDKCSSPYCSLCGITFASICSYQRHMRNSLRHVSHDQLRYICDHCKRRFSDKTKLRDHIEEKHLHKTFQCHICLKPSKNRVGLDQHIRNVHKGRPHNKLCHHCGKGFPTKVQLESHIRMHTGERPFACDFCPTTFSQLSNLYKHSRQVHSNVKPKRYPPNKKRKEEKHPEPPLDTPLDPYRPVAVLHYNAERGFVM